MCGIFGIINTRKTKFDKRAFFTLGINNDSRGGDSCGVFIDGQVDYGNGDNKLFINFFDKSQVLNDAKDVTIALGHCRKASVGGVAPEKTQPCTVTDEEGNIKFVLTHNGTIKNYEALAKKYIPNIDINGLTDSQVMTLIFYHCGFDALTEYIGTAAFVAVDYRGEKPKVYMFKGESLATKYTPTTSEERPLFCVTNKTFTVYSSISAYLYSLYHDQKVLTVNPNKLISINDKGELYVVKEYDRLKCLQQEPANVTVYPTKYNDYDDDEVYYPRYNRGSKSQGGEEARNTKSAVANGSVRLYMDNDFLVRTSPTYKAHGKYIVDEIGNTYKEEDFKTKDGLKTIFIFYGIVVNNRDAFDCLTTIANAWSCTPAELIDILPQIAYALSPYPIKDYQMTKNYHTVVLDADLEHTHDFTGTIQKLFTGDVYSYNKGVQEYNLLSADIKETFALIDAAKDCEIPREIIIDYLNDLV